DHCAARACAVYRGGGIDIGESMSQPGSRYFNRRSHVVGQRIEIRSASDAVTAARIAAITITRCCVENECRIGRDLALPHFENCHRNTASLRCAREASSAARSARSCAPRLSQIAPITVRRLVEQLYRGRIENLDAG